MENGLDCKFRGPFEVGGSYPPGPTVKLIGSFQQTNSLLIAKEKSEPVNTPMA